MSLTWLIQDWSGFGFPLSDSVVLSALQSRPGGLQGGWGDVCAGGDGSRCRGGAGPAGGWRGDRRPSPDLLPPPEYLQPGPRGAEEEEGGYPELAREEPGPCGGGGRWAEGGGGPDHQGPVQTWRLLQLQPDHPGPHPETDPECDQAPNRSSWTASRNWTRTWSSSNQFILDHTQRLIQNLIQTDIWTQTGSVKSTNQIPAVKSECSSSCDWQLVWNQSDSFCPI